MTDITLYFLLIFISTLMLSNIITSKARWIVLLIGSISFYVLAIGKQAFLLALIPILFSYFGAILITKTNNEKHKKMIMATAISAIVIELVFFKFAGVYNYLGGVISGLFNIKLEIINNFIIPMGLSYYSLILIAYVMDVYWGSVVPQTNILKYFLFSLFSPYVTMGPIVRYNEIKDELYSQEDVDFNRIKFGFFRILWGIAKKIIIADRMALFTSEVLNNYNSTPSGYVLLATVFFGIQFYIDFSAAMDIGLGAAECFGIKLPENFRNPFFCKSFQDFWQRWHITFHLFLRDYVFFPVIRSNVVDNFHNLFDKYRNNLFVKYMPFFIGYAVVWVISGFWHCIALKYILPCAVFPLIAVNIEDLFINPLYKKDFCKNNKKMQVLCRIFHLVFLHAVLTSCSFFFNSPSIAEGCAMYKKIIFNLSFSDYGMVLDVFDIAVIITGIIIIYSVDIIKELKVDLAGIYVNLPTVLRWLILCLMTVLILLLGLYGPVLNPQDFVYQRF